MSARYIVVLGGVYSGSGKGIASAAIGLLLQMRGLRVKPCKFDPYLNINAGVLSPREHGEVFLCDDGSETDLDLGTYERIIGCQVSGENILTAGQINKELIIEEDDGKYLGQTIQCIPHFTDKIIDRLVQLGQSADVVIVEIGGTVGDFESEVFLRAIRQFKQRNWNDVLTVMVAPIIWVQTIKEFKTKPLQNAVEKLNSFGLQPDILLCRVDHPPLPVKMLDKIAHLTNVPREAVFDAPDVRTVYQVPIECYNRHIDDLIADKFHFNRNGVRIHKFRDLVEKYLDAQDMPEIEIGIVCKYANCDEAYQSLKEAVYHAAVANSVRVNIRWIHAEEVENTKRGMSKYFDGLHGLIVPGGFDGRGVEGKIKAVKYAREKKLPFLGICLGLQCAVIEYARFRGLEAANSVEFDPQTPHPVIHYVEGQEGLRKKSGTMRLGAYDCEIVKDSLTHDVYKKRLISERHRHRFEVNPKYASSPEFKCLKVTGRHPGSGLIEIMEMDRDIHPYFIGTQAHPEFKSRLGEPAPLFNGLIAAAVARKTAELPTEPMA